MNAVFLVALLNYIVSQSGFSDITNSLIVNQLTELSMSYLAIG